MTTTDIVRIKRTIVPDYMVARKILMDIGLIASIHKVSVRGYWTEYWAWPDGVNMFHKDAEIGPYSAKITEVVAINDDLPYYHIYIHSNGEVR